MTELYTEVYQKAIDLFADYYEKFESEVQTPFIHLGLAYIDFAKEERKLFQLLFLSDNRGDRSLYELLNGSTGAVAKEINKACGKRMQQSKWIIYENVDIHPWMCMHGINRRL